MLRAFARQHWLKHGRDRVVRFFCSPDGRVDLPFVCEFYGFKYRGNLNNFIDWSVYFYNGYSRNELLLLRDLASRLRDRQEFVTFYDIGANVGQHSLFMAGLADEVFSFEPYDACVEKIREKIADNQLRNLHVFPLALGGSDSTGHFYLPEDWNGNRGIGTLADHGVSVARPMREIAVRSGDELFREQNLPKIDLLKIDVEGWEQHVLMGLQRRLRDDRPVILMEISGDSRNDFGDEEGLCRLLFPEHLIRSVGMRSVSGPYILGKFDFETADEILIVPKEKVSLLRL